MSDDRNVTPLDYMDVPEKVQEDPSGYEAMSDTVAYVVNLNTGTIHRWFRDDKGATRDNPGDNLDDLNNARTLETREEVFALFYARKLQPRPCHRCFPQPTAADEKEARKFKREEPDAALLKA